MSKAKGKEQEIFLISPQTPTGDVRMFPNPFQPAEESLRREHLQVSGKPVVCSLVLFMEWAIIIFIRMDRLSEVHVVDSSVLCCLIAWEGSSSQASTLHPVAVRQLREPLQKKGMFVPPSLRYGCWMGNGSIG